MCVCVHRKFGVGTRPSQQYKEDPEVYNGRYFVDYLGYCRLWITTEGNAIMNAHNVRRLSVYVNSRNQDFSLIGLGMRLPLPMMSFDFKVANPYNPEILAILKFGGLAPNYMV